MALHLNYPFEFTEILKKIITLIDTARKNGELSPLESFNLMCKMEHFIDNPKEYKEFLGVAKSCEMVAGGRLAAYITLLAGWAAIIVSAGSWGDAYINYANQKLE